jgi:hypothetical protein
MTQQPKAKSNFQTLQKFLKNWLYFLFPAETQPISSKMAENKTIVLENVSAILLLSFAPSVQSRAGNGGRHRY